MEKIACRCLSFLVCHILFFSHHHQWRSKKHKLIIHITMKYILYIAQKTIPDENLWNRMCKSYIHHNHINIDRNKQKIWFPFERWYGCSLDEFYAFFSLFVLLSSCLVYSYHLIDLKHLFAVRNDDDIFFYPT